MRGIQVDEYIMREFLSALSSMSKGRVFCFALLCVLSLGSTAWACSSPPCTQNSECSANPCRWCDSGGSGECADCCTFTDTQCPETCTFIPLDPFDPECPTCGECRNIAEVACGTALPEVPKDSRRIFLLAPFALLLPLLFFSRRRIFKLLRK